MSLLTSYSIFALNPKGRCVFIGVRGEKEGWGREEGNVLALPLGPAKEKNDPSQKTTGNVWPQSPLTRTWFRWPFLIRSLLIQLWTVLSPQQNTKFHLVYHQNILVSTTLCAAITLIIFLPRSTPFSTAILQENAVIDKMFKMWLMCQLVFRVIVWLIKMGGDSWGTDHGKCTCEMHSQVRGLHMNMKLFGS